MSRFVSWIGLAMLVACAPTVYFVRQRIGNVDASPALVGQLHARLDRLPRRLGDGLYEPKPYELDPEVVRRSGADTHITRGYRDGDGAIYHVYIGGAIRNQESFHAPNYCMPAAGWEVLSQRSVASPMGEEGSRLRRLDLRKGDARMLVYYWFQCGRRQTDHDLVARWYRFLDFVANVLDRSPANVIQPTMIATIYVPFSGAVDSAEERALAFMERLGPVLGDAMQPEES